jgi:hypothetical protein
LELSMKADLAALLIVSGAALAVAGCASGPSMTASAPTALNTASVGASSDVPVSLRTPPSQALFLVATGTGVQIYECKAAAAAAAGYAWTFRAPEAWLTDASGVRIGKHYAGPTWESIDGSMVIGEATASSPAPASASIPWLLLTVKATTGSGVLTQTKSVQRLQTVGGVAPVDGCSANTTGEVARVPYKATYAFFRVVP